MNTKLIYYHSPCTDGHASAWVVRKFFIATIPYNDLELIMCKVYLPKRQRDFFDHLTNFLQTVTPNQTIDVICLDISFGIEAYDFLASQKKVKKFVIIDHHISGYREMLTGYSKTTMPNEYVFDLKESGCTLTWKYFFTEPVPLTLQYIKDRDIWEWALPHSKEINAGLFKLLEQNSFKSLNKFIANENENLKFAKKIGTDLLSNSSENIRGFNKRMKYGTVIEFRGHNVFIINTDKAGDTPEFAHYILTLKNEDDSYYCDYVIVWRYSYFLRGYKISFTTQEDRDVDVSLIAKKLNPEGGGHTCASGCTVTELPKEFLLS